MAARTTFHRWPPPPCSPPPSNYLFVIIQLKQNINRLRLLGKNLKIHDWRFLMDSTPVNWEALDALVIDFAKSERLIDDSSLPASSSSSQSSSYRWRLLICQVRRSMESADIDSAIQLLRTYAPAVLDDHRLLFRLQKQVCHFDDFSIAICF